MQDPQPDFHPVAGQPETLEPGLRRVLAPNPSPMTFRGTNTYLIGTTEIAVIDPGPDDPAHLAAILDALEPGQRITAILVTHAHVDHSPLSRALSRATGAPVYGFGGPEAGRSEIMQQLAKAGGLGGGEGVDAAFAPDILMADKTKVTSAEWSLTALHTPGHMANHLSFAWKDRLFCGDLVMGWASSLVSPPDGDLTDFMASLHRLIETDWRVFHSGHGAPIDDPRQRLSELIAHRQMREAAIIEHLGQGPANAAALAARIYTETPPALLPAAERNVLAHLVDLVQKNVAQPVGPLSRKAMFELV